MRRSFLKTIMRVLAVLSLVACFHTVKLEVFEAPGVGNGTAEEDRSVEDKIRELRIEMVKIQILSRLNLKEPLQTAASPANDSEEAVKLLLRETEEQEQDPNRRRGRQQRLIIPAKGSEMECSQMNTSSCKMFQYEFSATLNASAMDLWVYNRGEFSRGIAVFLNLSSSSEEKQYDNFYFEVKTAGWNKLGLLPTLLLPSLWNDSVISLVEITGEDVEYHGSRRPYLMASKALQVTLRSRRDSECDTNESCCKRPLRLSFSEIGFDFIVYPEELEANMCIGKCRLDHSTLRTHYETALTTTIEKNSTIREALGDCWIPCCKPKQLKEVRVIYKDIQNLHHDQIIPELSVESCSCS